MVTLSHRILVAFLMIFLLFFDFTYATEEQIAVAEKELQAAIDELNKLQKQDPQSRLKEIDQELRDLDQQYESAPNNEQAALLKKRLEVQTKRDKVVQGYWRLEELSTQINGLQRKIKYLNNQPNERKGDPVDLTMSDMRAIATAVQAYAIDNNSNPQVSTMNELAGKIEPLYILATPAKDAWGRPFVYSVNQSNGEFFIASYGPDGKPDSGLYDQKGHPVKAKLKIGERSGDDLIFIEHSFVHAPNYR